jgi:hypothetical protein
MTKDAGIVVAIPPDLKEWVDAQAEDIGVNAAIWIRMLVFAARKGRGAPAAPVAPVHAALPAPSGEVTVLQWRDGVQPLHGASIEASNVDRDAWRGAVDDEPASEASGVDVDAMIAARVAEADASGAFETMAPVEAFGSPPQADIVYGGFGGVRSLHRPPMAFAAGNQPRHLRNAF